MANTLLQSTSATGSSVTSITATFTNPTTGGSLLVAHINAKGNATSITPPAGWQAVPGTPLSPGTQALTVGMYYLPGAAAGQTSFVFNLGSAQNVVLILEEWSGPNNATPYDVSATSTDPTGAATQTVGPTSTTPAAAGELALVAHGYNNGTQRSISSETSGYSESIAGGVFGGTNSGLFALHNAALPDATAPSFTDTLNGTTGGGQVLILAVFKAGANPTTTTVQAGARLALRQQGVGRNAAATLALTTAAGFTTSTRTAGASMALQTAAPVLPPGTYGAGTYGSGPYSGYPTRVAGATIALFAPVTAPPLAPPSTRGLKVVHAGQDITSYVIELNEGSTLHDSGAVGASSGGGSSDDLSIVSVLGQGPGVGSGGSGHATTCEFSVWLGPAAKAVGKNSVPSGTDLVRQGEIQIFDARGTTIFGGYVTGMDDVTDSINPKTHLTCHDYWQHLDRIQVNEHYFNMGDVSIIKDLLTKYATFIDQTLLPGSDTITYPDKRLKGSLREVIQKLADETGWMVWVDPEKAMHYVSPSSAQTAPFGLSDDPDSISTQGYALSKYTIDDTALINRVTFYGGKSDSPDFTQDMSVQANGSNKTFFIAYQSHKASDGAYHLVKNGVELALGSLFDTSDAGKFKSAGGTSDALINADARIITFDVAPAATDTLTFTYRYQTPLVIILANTQSYNYYGDWYEGRITDSTVFDTNLALQRCRVLLAQQAFGLVSVSVTTWTPGLQAGQLVHIVNGVRGVDDTFLVQQVTTKPLGGGEFEYDIDLGAWNWNLIDILVQNARILNPTDGATEEDVTIIQAKESVASATVEILINHTTHISGDYYSGQDPTFSGFFTVTS